MISYVFVAVCATRKGSMSDFYTSQVAKGYPPAFPTITRAISAIKEKKYRQRHKC